MVVEMLQEGTLKSNNVVYHQDGQCHDFCVIYDGEDIYETKDDHHIRWQRDVTVPPFPSWTNLHFYSHLYSFLS